MRTVALSLCLFAGAAMPVFAGDVEIKLLEKTEYKSVFGQVESRDSVTARARIGGTVTQLRVDEGDNVKQGDLIAVVVDDKLAIQAKAIDARMSALDAQRANAKADLERAQQLARTGVVARTQVEAYQTQVNILNNQVIALKADKAVIYQQSTEGSVFAPSSGRVIAVPITKGTVIMPGESVARIAGGGYFLRLALPERHAAQIVEGSDLLVERRGVSAGTAVSLETALKGKLVKVYPEIEGGRMTADVEVQWPDGYSVPDAVRDYCMFGISSRGMGLGATVTGAGGL